MAEGSVARFKPQVLAWVLMGIADLVGPRFAVWQDTPDLDSFLDDVVAMSGGRRPGAGRGPTSTR